MGKKRVDSEGALKDTSLEVEEVESEDDILNLDAENIESVVNSETLDDALKIVEASLPKVQIVETGRLWILTGGSHSFHCPLTGELKTIYKGDKVRIEADNYDELPPWAKGKVTLAVVI